MLTTLRIKNLALVTDLTVEFRPGYNVITGETGAGKSILIGALNLVLGERADRTLLRSSEQNGAPDCTVEAVFDTSGLRMPVESFLEGNGLEPCDGGQLILKRTLSASGANRQFINGSPTSLSLLASLGQWLVDIHGPHDHQSLLQPARQLQILDAFGGLEQDRTGFEELVARRSSFEKQKASLIVDDRTYAQQLDLLRFQVREIAEAALQPDAEAQAESDFRRANNTARLLELSQAALGLLAEQDASVMGQAAAVGRLLRELARIDSSGAPLLSSQEQAVAILRELQSELSRYSEMLDLDQDRLKQLEERLNLIQSLKRKYGATVSDVLAFGDDARRKLESLEQRNVELRRIDEGLREVEAEIMRAGKALTAKRRKVIPKLTRAVAGELADLGFLRCQFEVALTALDPANPSDGTSKSPRPAAAGFDSVEFMFAPNPGEPARALRSIASSGELARVMLALKTVLAEVDEVPVLIFDEVDANVGGETANAVGEKMLLIAARRQVLCITHLPQVAAPASVHFVVTKRLKDGRTVSDISLLAGRERVTELARMLGGQSDVARKHAEAMLR
jgi:DNA repair protein RecN (Recombination protein N)